jgi:DeoR family transcriptional regulator, aga operon transcriptional repressor
MPRKPSVLLAGARRREILKILKRDGRLSVEDLVSRFRVSAVTLRADLGQLAEAGHLVRSYGGAILAQDPAEDTPIRVKQSLHHAEKVRIAQAAARLVEPGQTVILDSGSTSAELAKAITHRHLSALTVITHALNIAQEFLSSPAIAVVVIGGVMRHVSASAVGPQAERMVRELGAHHFFLGLDGLTPDLELATPDVLEAQLNRIMMEVAEQTTLIADGSKFGRRSLSTIGKVDRVKRVITDASADSGMIARIRQSGVEVLVV